MLSLRGVGPQVAARLANLGIHSVQDLLFHLPMRYEDRTRVVPVGSLRPGMQAVIDVEVQLTETVYRRRPTLLCRVSDNTGALTLRFFHFSKAQAASLVRGMRLRCYGEVRPGPATLEMVHPEYLIVSASGPVEVEQTLTPIYPATEGVQQRKLRDLTDQALVLLAEKPTRLPEYLPEDIPGLSELPNLHDALRYVHRPPPQAPVEELAQGRHPAQQRLAFEELLAHHLSLRHLRLAADRTPADALAGDDSLVAAFRASLPFTLTAAQERVCAEVFADLAESHPMMRLVQGDVGSGKTVVAALAALRAIEAGAQVALMAPTELLAEQHFRNFDAWLTPLGVRAVWLAGRLRAKARREALAEIASGDARLVVGTHALFQDDVHFERLRLIIIDEQHRFGVHQRLALKEKGVEADTHPHQLIMTATPIPRTLAMTAYADLDTSVIDELPPGRTPVQTVVIPDSRRDEVVARVERAARDGRQVYWVCPLIEESEVLQYQAAEETAARLAEALPDLRVGLVHGRMRPVERDKVMQAFKGGGLELLVATTVIEVGVDVPAASLMIIENAERLGLSQLHQLRGRVGRGSAESSCVLMYHGSLSELARARLAAMRETTDGFEISRRDLELRGPGEVLGTRQTGMVTMRIADLLRDADLLPRVQAAASALLARSPRRADGLIARWLGDGGRYAGV